MRRIITIKDVQELYPCTDPLDYVSEDWQGTLTDILNLEKVPVRHRLWVVIQFLDDRTNRLFAVWYARRALAKIENPDPRSIAACDVAERFANGEATSEELLDASDDASEAAVDAARTASDAFWAASRTASWAATWAASEVAWFAARNSSWAARTARIDAWSAEENMQLEKLKEIVKDM